MGDITSNRPTRLLAAMTTVVAAGMLLTSCAGLAGPGATAEPSEAVVATDQPAPLATETGSAVPTPTPLTTEAAAKAAVEPFVTAAVWGPDGLDVGAVVPKVVETGGTCTATAVRDGVIVSRSGAAVAASSYTGCPQLLLKDDQLTPGAWTITVSYSSDASSGTSAPKTVTVQ